MHFSGYEKLQKHQDRFCRKSEKLMKFICKFKSCEQKFFSAETAKIHEIEVHQMHSESKSRLYKCKLCRFKTLYSGNFERHMIVHEDREGNFECKFCKAKFDFPRVLQRHLKLYH